MAIGRPILNEWRTELVMILFGERKRERLSVPSFCRYLAIPSAPIDIAASDVFPNFSVPQVKVSRCAKIGSGKEGARGGGGRALLSAELAYRCHLEKNILQQKCAMSLANYG